MLAGNCPGDTIHKSQGHLRRRCLVCTELKRKNVIWLRMMTLSCTKLALDRRGFSAFEFLQDTKNSKHTDCTLDCRMLLGTNKFQTDFQLLSLLPSIAT